MTYSCPYRFVIALLFAGLLQSSLAGATPEFSFTWRDLTDGTITHTVMNSGATAEKWTATVVPLAAQIQGPPRLVVEPQSRDAVAPSTSVLFRLRLEPAATPALGSSFRYLLTVERTSGDQTTRERAIIRIGPVISLVPQSQTAKYVFTATRPIPFLCPWEIRTPLRLSEAPHPDRLKEAVNRPLGVLYVGSQAASLDHSAVIRWGANVTGDTQVILLGLDFPRWSSAKLAGTLNFPDGQTREVVVQTSDFVAYPLLVIIVGVSVAYAVKRYVTRDRALLVLRATLADTEARLKLADAEFPRTRVDKSIAGFEILPAWSKFRTEIEADIQSLQLTTGVLDQTNAAFTALSTKIMSSRKLPADWTAFGTNLRALDTFREGLAEIDPPATLNGRSSIEEALAAAERGEPLPTVDTLTTLAARVTSLIAAGQSWRATWDRSVKLAGVQNNQAAKADIDEAQRKLWLRFDEPTFAEVKQLLDSATARIVKAGGPAPAQRETVRSPEQQPPVAVPEALKLQRDDRLTVLVGLGLAVLVGLNAEYFGKPFGSVGDYARVLAWALSASIGVDLASLALNRIGSTLASSRVTRA